jgi:hypothetical protein
MSASCARIEKRTQIKFDGVGEMNSYLSRDEKEHLVRVFTLREAISQVINVYAGLKNVDKKFLGELRHSKSRLENAVEIRLKYLDKQALHAFEESSAKINIKFLPTPEALKANKEILQLKSTLPMAIEDFQDWYSFVIESTCKTCTRADYEACPARRVLAKYEVFPIDPGAKEKCQYSYASDLAVTEPATPGLVEKPEFANLGGDLEALQLRVSEYDRLKMVINDILHPNGDGPTNPSMFEIVAYIRSDWNRFTKEAQELRRQLEGLKDEEDPLRVEIDFNELCHELDGLPVTLALKNGIKTVMSLPEHMTECLIEEIQRPNRFSRSICAKFVDGEFVAIDMQEVVAMHVSGLPEEEWIKPQPTYPVYEFTTEQERYRVECKCGAEYFCKMNPNRPKARCRDCQGTVFADRQVDKIPDPSDEADATLLTNRYFVSRDPYQAREPYQETTLGRDLREISKNHGREYIDPCSILG